MGDHFVVVHRTFDPIEVEVVLDLLAQNGIDARGLGTRHGALIGVGQGILEQRVEVPEDRAAEAAELIAAFLRPEQPVEPEPTAAEPEQPAPPKREATTEPEEPRLRPILAAGAVLAIFGGSHFYARRTVSGLVIALAQLAAFAALLAGDYDAGPAAGLVVVGLLALDLVGGQLAVRAFNHGRRASRGRQLAVSLVGVVLVAGGAGVVASNVPPPAPEPDELDLLVPLLPGPDDERAQDEELFRILELRGLPGFHPDGSGAPDGGSTPP
ncbi:MAG: DUF2007 domain-containing protein [Deltaproteobacteria bacterium]|nr:DUF2007 domain-containing protein [Deltaproteobacteria bacterium]